MRQGRRGKHYKLVENILKQLKTLPEGRAMRIPLDSVEGVPKANLRSAITRAAAFRENPIATYSDKDNLYIWNRTKVTARYERKRKAVPARNAKR